MSDGMAEFDDTRKPAPETRHFRDLVVLGNAVPDEISDHRITVCTVAYSEECGLIRIYPVPPEAPIKRWDIVSVTLERNPGDTRLESWKMPGSRSEWDKLSEKIEKQGELKQSVRPGFVDKLREKYGYKCIKDINNQKRSFGIIVPTILGHTLDRQSPRQAVQTTLIDKEHFMTTRDYSVRPSITYRCPECKAKGGQHKQGLLEWGAYEWCRKNPENPEQVWDNLCIDDPLYDKTFLVGNMKLHRSSFLIISVFRFKHGAGRGPPPPGTAPRGAPS